MHESANFLAITATILDTAPPEVQEHVKEYYKRENVLGKDCWVAFMGSLRKSWGDFTYRNAGVSNMRWSDEFKKFVKSNPDDCFEFYASWDSACSGPAPD